MTELIFDSASTINVQSLSCDRCKAQKLKCTRQWPCGNCDRKSLTCYYTRKRKPRNVKSRSSIVMDSRPKTCLTYVPNHALWARTSGSGDSGSGSDSVSTHSVPPSPTQQDKTSQSIDSTTTYQDTPQNQGFHLDDGEQANFLNLVTDNVNGSADLTNFNCELNWQDNPSTPSSSTSLFLQKPIEYLVLGETTLSADHVSNFWPANIPDSLVTKIVDLYLRQLHPSIPIFKASDLTRCLANGQHRTNRQFGAMILALCTFTLLQPQQPNNTLLAGVPLVPADFLRESNSMHSANSIGQDPTLDSILTNLYLFVSLDLLKQINAARLRLQEAITISEILGLHHTSSSHIYDADEWEKRTRIYLFLTVAERAYAAGKLVRLTVPSVPSTVLHTFTELSLQRRSQGDVKEANNLAALRLLVGTFDCLDSDVISCWHDDCSLIGNGPACDRLSAARILALIRKVPRQHNEDWLLIAESRSTASFSTYSTKAHVNEQGDILVTSLWVLDRLWHLALTHGHLTFDNENPELRFSFAKSIAREVLTIFKLFTMSSLEQHGEGLDLKVFDIASDFLHFAFGLDDHGTPPDAQGVNNFEVDEYLDIPVRLKSDQPTTDEMSNLDIANGLLGFFALFKNGRTSYFTAYMDIYNQFTSERRDGCT